MLVRPPPQIAQHQPTRLGLRRSSAQLTRLAADARLGVRRFSVACLEGRTAVTKKAEGVGKEKKKGGFRETVLLLVLGVGIA
ncbi:hypothetical protein AB0J09_44965, partial [Nonomuraea sp. NPDC049784]